MYSGYLKMRIYKNVFSVFCLLNFGSMTFFEMLPLYILETFIRTNSWGFELRPIYLGRLENLQLNLLECSVVAFLNTNLIQHCGSKKHLSNRKYYNILKYFYALHLKSSVKNTLYLSWENSPAKFSGIFIFHTKTAINLTKSDFLTENIANGQVWIHILLMVKFRKYKQFSI